MELRADKVNPYDATFTISVSGIKTINVDTLNFFLLNTDDFNPEVD